MDQYTTTIFIDELDEHNPPLTDIATRNVVRMAATDSVGEAATLMRERRISSIVVTDRTEQPTGIVTERNILQAMRDDCPHETNLEDIMSSPVITVSLFSTTLEAYQVCLDHGIRHLVIVDDKEELAGVVSETDFRLHLNLAALAGRRRVSTVAKRSAIVLSPNTRLDQAIELMLMQRKSCVVAAEDEKPVGIVTERDVVRFYSSDESCNGITLGDAMTSPIQTIHEDCSTSKAAETMLACKLRHLVVVDGKGCMTGLISEHDLTRAMETSLEEKRKGIEKHFLRTLINTIPDLVWLKDVDGIFLACNARFESFFGAKERDIVGKTDYDFIDRELADSFREHDRMALEANRPTINEEWIIYADDGHRELLETVKTPMHDRNGNLIGILGIARDITARKRAEQELHEKEERLALATLHNGVGIWDWNLVTQEMIWDDSMYTLYHIRREDFSGSEEAWRAALHPDDLERGDREVEEAIAGIRPFDTEFRVIWPGGEVRHIKAVAKVFRDDKGNPLRMLGTNVDITERKRLEEQLAQNERKLHDIYDSVSDCIEIISMDGVIVDMNRAGYERIGYTREEVIGRKLADFSSPEFALRVAERSEQIKAEGEVTFESARLHKDGTLIPIEVSSRLVELGGEPVFLGISRDITERKRIDAVNTSRWHLAKFALKHSLDELLEETLNEAEKLTDSLIGFYHFVEDDQVSLTLQNWSKRTKAEFCKAEGKGLHYPIDEAGVWVDCVRERKAVIHNDYASLAHRKGLPEGHAAVIRELVVPVYRGDKITAILGVGNKPTDYTEHDLEVATLLADVAWEIAERKRNEEERRKLSAILMQSDEPVTLTDTEARYVYANPAFCRLFGYELDELRGQHISLLAPPEEISGPDSHQTIADARDKGDFHGEVRRRTKDGRIVPILLRVAPFLDEQGVLTGYIASITDLTEIKQMQNALRESEKHFRNMLEHAPIGMATSSLDGHIIMVNRAFCDMLGREKNEFEGLTYLDLGHPEDRAVAVPYRQKLLDGEIETYQVEKRFLHKNGQVVWGLITSSLERDSSGNPLYFIAQVEDITERKRAEENLRITASVFDTSQEAIVITDANNIITDVNPAFTHITGYSREEVLGRNPNLLSSGRHGKEFYTTMWQSLMQKGSWRGEIWNRRKNGEIYAEMLSISVIRDRNGEALRHVAVFSDISHIKAHEAELSRVAHYDALTGIPNRVLLADRMKQALARTKRERNMMAVCYIDLDGFKPINDHLGHDAGDQVLVEVSRRIEKTIRGGDTVARLGGDEFVILLLGLKRAKECVTTLNRLLHEIALPIDLDGKAVKLGASIGVSIYPQDDEDADTLLRHADQAMYLAKQAGKHRYHIYDPSHDRRARDYNEFMQTIRHALAENQFELYYQPKIDLKSKRLLGVEALIRWNHPERGLLAPFEFLPAIENSDLDIEIGEWVVETALEQLDRWQRAGLDIEISVNISAYHLESSGFVEMLRRQLANYPQVLAGRLQIEVLETTALEDIAVVNDIINACRQLGVGFALDDFGTGYSSLAYLSRLPIDTLKIDQSFVRGMLEDKGDMAIVQGVIALARAFKLRIVAEGIETVEHYNALLGLGCEVGQGYVIARPMPAHELEHWRIE